MRRLTFDYRLQITLNAPVTDHHFTLRCTPLSDARQQIEQLDVQITPYDFLSSSCDPWGNALLYGAARRSHTGLCVTVSGSAATGLAACTPQCDPTRDMAFLYPTALTAPDAAIRAFAQTLPEGRACALAEAAMERLYTTLVYTPGATSVSTTAAQSFSLRQGVCQDYSHIMLSVLRCKGICCRYAAGMLLGEGKSHAWVEVLQDGCWYGYDPTNCRTVTDEHIKLSHGRDARDCSINRGIFRGWAMQTSDISVIVKDEAISKNSP